MESIVTSQTMTMLNGYATVLHSQGPMQVPGVRQSVVASYAGPLTSCSAKHSH